MITRLNFWLSSKRIGPDMPLTHWMLYFPGLGAILAKRKLSRFGERSEIRPHSYLVCTESIEIGNNVVIRPNCMLMATEDGRIVIGNDVLIGSNVHFYVADHRFEDREMTIVSQGHKPSRDIVIEDDVWIGGNVTILRGVRVGRHSVIAAGSVVTRSVESNSIYAGVPARKLKSI